MNKTQLIIIQKNQLKPFCILFNLTLESFVRSRWPEQVETLGGFMQPSSSFGSHSVSWLDEGLSIPPSS